MTDCGDCPGLLVPRVKLLSEVADNLGRPLDAIHLGTCVKLAMETATSGQRSSSSRSLVTSFAPTCSATTTKCAS